MKYNNIMVTSMTELHNQSEKVIFAIKDQIEMLERFATKGEVRKEQEIKEYLDLLKLSKSIAKPIDPTR